MDRFVRVSPSASGLWTVDTARAESVSFRRRPSAVAFGRALAYSTQRDLLVESLDGAIIRQSRASLTYPRELE